jgi:hypothetical protein
MRGVTMVTSRGRAALDTWLADAEGLLAEQRERSLSPSSYAGSEPDRRHESTSTLGEVAAGLEHLLGQLTAAPGRWILIINDAQRPSRFVQFLSHEDGSLISEATSNFFLDAYPDRRLSWTKAQEKNLAALGWESPEPPGRPNWVEVWPVFSPPVDLVATRALRTLREVFELGDDDTVLVKMFSSPNRGGTPASEVEEPQERVGDAKSGSGQL